MVYIIKRGEFEITKRIKTEEKKDLDIMKFIGPSSSSEHLNEMNMKK
jgi:hypothetical protein